MRQCLIDELKEKLSELSDEQLQIIKGWLPRTLTLWSVQVMYRHRGRGIMFENLPAIEHECYEEAMQDARAQAERFIEKSGEPIESWDVKVRPCTP